MKKENLGRFLYLLLIVIVVFSALNIYFIQTRINKVQYAEKIAQEKAKPALLEVIALEADCQNCYTIDNAIEELKKQNVNITKLDTLQADSSQGEEYIKKYAIDKLPALIITGEIDKEQLKNFFEKIGSQKDNAIIYTAIKPPYFDLIQKKVMGEVSLTHLIDASCKECTSLSAFSDALKKSGVFIKSEKMVPFETPDGKELIKRFEIKHVPALLISDDINVYNEIKEQLTRADSKEKNGFYAIHSTLPPYRNLSENKVIGLVTLIMIKDSSCSQCYDVSVNKQILQRFGMYIKEEKNYDISSKEGKELIAKYNITKVPLIIVSPDASVYPVFVSAWNDVGTVENKWFVMRNTELLGTYKDLQLNKVVEVGQ